MTNTQSPTAPSAHQIMEWSDEISEVIDHALRTGTLISSTGAVASWDNVSTFADLHDYCDANEFLVNAPDYSAPYGHPMFATDGEQSPAQVDAEHDAVNAVTARLDEWIIDTASELAEDAGRGSSRVVLNAYVTPSTGLFPASLATNADTLFDLSLFA